MKASSDKTLGQFYVEYATWRTFVTGTNPEHIRIDEKLARTENLIQFRKTDGMTRHSSVVNGMETVDM